MWRPHLSGVGGVKRWLLAFFLKLVADVPWAVWRQWVTAQRAEWKLWTSHWLFWHEHGEWCQVSRENWSRFTRRRLWRERLIWQSESIFDIRQSSLQNAAEPKTIDKQSVYHCCDWWLESSTQPRWSRPSVCPCERSWWIETRRVCRLIIPDNPLWSLDRARAKLTISLIWPHNHELFFPPRSQALPPSGSLRAQLFIC